MNDCNAEDILNYLTGSVVNSQNRLRWLLDRTEKCDSQTFLRVFCGAWSVCDNTWPFRDQVLRRLKCAKTKRICFESYLSGTCLEWFSSLPSVLTVFRGCSEARVNGLSWTTDKDTALEFGRGHRTITVPNPILISAQVDKNDVLFATNDREECEILVDWGTLRDITFKCPS